MTAVLTDRRIALPSMGSRTRAFMLVIGGALLTAAAAHVSVRLSWTPVPITGQTLAVLLVGGALGWRRGSASIALYVALGAAGLPFYAEAADGSRGGWTIVTGPTAGYLVGFVAAAALIGWLAERGQDRRLDTNIPAMLAGTAVIYLCGVGWLAHSLGIDVTKAMELGFTPFVLGDLIKLLFAGSVLPLMWRRL